LVLFQSTRSCEREQARIINYRDAGQFQSTRSCDREPQGAVCV